MNKFLKKIIGDIGDKKEWKAMERRAKALPGDYQVVYDEIKQYMWKSSGLESTDVFKGLLDLFEEGAANGTQVLEITGDDVAAFCDELVRGEKTYTEKWRKTLNRDIAKKLGK
jgi:DNA-binding ferritin-like protein (Dps family)